MCWPGAWVVIVAAIVATVPQMIWSMFSLVLSKIQSVADAEGFPTLVAPGGSGADRDGWAWPGWRPGPSQAEGGGGGGGGGV